MGKIFFSEKILIEELTEAASKAKERCKGLSIGDLIRMIRLQLGMSQVILSKRAGVPQSTISRIEKGVKEVNLSTLNKILYSLSCDLLIAPLLKEPIDVIRRKQANKKAIKRINYLKGTMNLEDQEPDSKLIKELLQQEENRLLQSSDSELWKE